jgi:threonine synthase
MTGDRFTWRPGDVEVRPPGKCQACGKPADDPEIKGLCRDCAVRIDRDYEALHEIADLEHRP